MLYAETFPFCFHKFGVTAFVPFFEATHTCNIISYVSINLSDQTHIAKLDEKLFIWEKKKDMIAGEFLMACESFKYLKLLKLEICRYL